MRNKNKLVYGVGINDAEYNVHITKQVGGKMTVIWKCPYYRSWQNMLERCYSGVHLKKHPTYRGCSVCDEWLTFSNFKSWMEQQDWVGKELDKDLLFDGNKQYSPETCVFLDSKLNTFLINRCTVRGDWPLGVYLDKCRNKFKAHCRNPFTGKQENLGYFNCPLEAHKVWKQKKHEHACFLADLQEDERVAKALRERYATNKIP